MSPAQPIRCGFFDSGHAAWIVLPRQEAALITCRLLIQVVYYRKQENIREAAV